MTPVQRSSSPVEGDRMLIPPPDKLRPQSTHSQGKPCATSSHTRGQGISVRVELHSTRVVSLPPNAVGGGFFGKAP